MGLAILTCQDPNSEHKSQPVTFSTFCSHLHMRTAQSAQPSIQDQSWRPAAGKASFRIWSPGWERTQKAPLIITQLTLRSLSFWGYFFSEVHHHFKAPEVPTSNTMRSLPTSGTQEPNSRSPSCIFEGCFAQLFLQTSEVFHFLAYFSAAQDFHKALPAACWLSPPAPPSAFRLLSP